MSEVEQTKVEVGFSGGGTPPMLPGNFQDHYRDKDRAGYILVRGNATLPALCLKTGQPLTGEHWRKKVTIAWSPPWVYIGILGGILPLLILILIAQKKGEITYSLSPGARKSILKRRLIGLGVLLAAITAIGACFFTGAESNDITGILALTGFLLLIASLVIMILAAPIRATGHRNGWFRIKGAGPDFVSTLIPRSLSEF